MSSSPNPRQEAETSPIRILSENLIQTDLGLFPRMGCPFSGTFNLASTWVFIFQWQEPALPCVAPSMAKLVHALGLEGIMWIKGVSSQKQAKGCTLPKDWSLCEFSQEYEGDPQPFQWEPDYFLEGLPHFKLWAFSLDLDFLTTWMGDCSLTLAMDLSLAKNQKTPILTNQLVERGQTHTK